jgi:hypothetical protein
MKFSTYALAAAVVASVANGFAGPQVTPRFALQVRAPTCEVAVCLWHVFALQQQQQQQQHYRNVYPSSRRLLQLLWFRKSLPTCWSSTHKSRVGRWTLSLWQPLFLICSFRLLFLSLIDN